MHTARVGNRQPLALWSLQGFPLIFHGVMGKDEREANSPSFFNVCEIEVLVDYLTKLMETQGKDGLPKLSAKDIGIIAPYRKQVGLTAIQSCFLQLWMNSLNTTSATFLLFLQVEKIQKALRSVAALKGLSDLKELKVRNAAPNISSSV